MVVYSFNTLLELHVLSAVSIVVYGSFGTVIKSHSDTGSNSFGRFVK